jgi:hypothetical protein
MVRFGCAQHVALEATAPQLATEMDISTREFLAGLAMAGMLSSQKTDTLETITNDAVIAADLLLKALGDSDHLRRSP